MDHGPVAGLKPRTDQSVCAGCGSPGGHGLIQEGIWLDGSASLQIISSGELFRTIRWIANQPPLCFILLTRWSEISAGGGWLRALSVLSGTGTILAIPACLKRYSNLASLVAGLVCATMPIMMWSPLDIRDYPLLDLSTELSFLFATGLIARPEGLSGFLGLAFSLSNAVTTHLVGVVVPSVCIFPIARMLEVEAGADGNVVCLWGMRQGNCVSG